MSKCTICLTRKGERKCLITNTFICSLCCGQTRKEDTCSSCWYFQNRGRYGKLGRKILLGRIGKSEYFREKTVVVNPENEEKMSRLLIDFAQPILDVANDDNAMKNVIEVAIVVWNAFVLPRRERNQIIKQLIYKLPPSDSKENLTTGKFLIRELMKRRKRYFSHNRRIIIDYQFSDEGEDFHLDVVSTASAQLSNGC